MVSTEVGQTESVDDEGWSPLPPPSENVPEGPGEVEQTVASEPMAALDDERAMLEAELARLDAERSHRISHTLASPPKGADSALADLESRLSDIEF